MDFRERLPGRKLRKLVGPGVLKDAEAAAEVIYLLPNDRKMSRTP
jgi:hypothetical protein